MTITRGRLTLLVLLFCMFSVTGFSTTPAEGRWSVVLETSEGNYIYPLDLRVDSGKISTTVLRGGLKVSSTQMRGKTVSIRGEFRSEPVTINLKIIGFTMSGTWRTAADSGKAIGEFQPAATRLKAFDEIWETTNSHFYSPLFNGIDWRALKEPYRKRVGLAKNDGEFYLVINEMLSKLRSSHVGFYTAERGIFSEVKPVQNIARSTTGGRKVVEWKQLNSNTGYLKISSFAEGEEYVNDIDKAFVAIGNLPSLVIDLRGNEGGTLSIAMRLGDHIFHRSQELGILATRAGLDRYKVNSIEKLDPDTLPKYSGYNVEGFLAALRQRGAVMLVTGGRVAKPYSGRIVVLTDGNSASASEGFISAIKETGAAKLIGRRTEGALLSSRDFEIIGGWTLKLPEADFCTPKGFRPEAVGIEPDIRVKVIPGRDADLEAALRYLNGN